MEILKMTIGNVQHSKQFLVEQPSAKVLDRIQHLKNTFLQMDSDIVLMVEGLKGETNILKFPQRIGS